MESQKLSCKPRITFRPSRNPGKPSLLTNASHSHAPTCRSFVRVLSASSARLVTSSQSAVFSSVCQSAFVAASSDRRASRISSWSPVYCKFSPDGFSPGIEASMLVTSTVEASEDIGNHLHRSYQRMNARLGGGKQNRGPQADDSAAVVTGSNSTRPISKTECSASPTRNNFNPRPIELFI